jgi:hypothetical protein
VKYPRKSCHITELLNTFKNTKKLLLIPKGLFKFEPSTKTESRLTPLTLNNFIQNKLTEIPNSFTLSQDENLKHYSFKFQSRQIKQTINLPLLQGLRAERHGETKPAGNNPINTL